MSLPECSVIIPVYNSLGFIEKTLESVLNQTFRNFEIIVVDDNSSDRSYEILKRISKKDHRVRIFRNDQNHGVAQTRNRGIELARGKYIALLDSDDIWLPEKLERQIAFMQEKGCSLTYCSYGFTDKNDNTIEGTFYVPPCVDLKTILKRNVISCSTVMADRQLFLRHKFKSTYYHEDYAVWIDMLKECKISYGYTGVLAKIRIMQGTRSGNKFNSAKHRWLIYRKHLKMNLFKAGFFYANYIFYSGKKYWELRKEL